MYSNKLTFFLLFSLALIQGCSLGFVNTSSQKQKVDEATQAFDEGNYQKTITIAKDFLQYSESANKHYVKNMYLLLGNAYQGIENYAKALSTYNTALEYFPDDISLNLSLAKVYYKTELFDKAIDNYKKVLENDANNTESLLGLARSYLKKGVPYKSRAYFEEYFTKNEKQDIDALYDFALVHFLSNNMDKSLSYALEVKKVRNDADVNFLISKIYRSQRKYTEAHSAIDIALLLAPDREDIYLTKMLWLAYNIKTAPAAEILVNQYLTKNPNSHLALVIKFTALVMQDRDKEAVDVIKKLDSLQDNSFSKRLAHTILEVPNVINY